MTTPRRVKKPGCRNEASTPNNPVAEAGTIHDVAIVGAGSAGIAAAKTARTLGLDYVVLEASHRIGGRAYTEELAPGVAFDLGCHWMHTASLNPYVAIADRFGFTYRKGTFPRGLWIDRGWASAADLESYSAAWRRYHAAIIAAGGAGSGISIAEATEREGRWTPLIDYWCSIANAVDPGWVRTDMGGRSAPRSAAQGVDTTVWLATLPDNGPTGRFFRDRKPIEW